MAGVKLEDQSATGYKSCWQGGPPFDPFALLLVLGSDIVGGSCSRPLLTQRSESLGPCSAARTDSLGFCLHSQ